MLAAVARWSRQALTGRCALPQLVDGGMVYDSINQGRRVDVLWPDDRWRQRGGKNAWGAWLPDGRCGTVVHYWCPSHPDRRYRCVL